MMGAARASALIPAFWSARLGCGLLLLVSLSLGCVDLKQPYVLAHPDGSVGGGPKGGRDGGSGTAGTGGSGSVPDSSGTAGTGGSSGTGGTDPVGGASGGSEVDAGLGGTTSTSSSTVDTGGVAGSTGIDASTESDGPQATGGSAPDAGTGSTGGAGGKSSSSLRDGGVGGTGGSAGRSGDAGGGNKPDADVDGSGSGGTGGAGGTTGKDGAAGQDAGVPDGSPVVPDAPLDTALPDAPCDLCGISSILVHRYSFNGSGSTITDSVGGANGTANSASLSGTGALTLGGTQYVELPAHLLSSLTSATLEIWVTWNGGSNNQRILDFGSNQTSGGKTQAVTTVIISPNSAAGSEAPRLRASYSAQASSGSTQVDSTAGTLPTGTKYQIVAVFDPPNQTLSMYLNGVLLSQTTGLGALSQINDVNNWLGKSQYSDDPGFSGIYHEFRIYNAPLTATQIQAVYNAGENAVFP